MAETVIGLFPQKQEGEEVVPMLSNRGYGQHDVEKLGADSIAHSSSGGDVVDKLADLGVVEVGQLELLVDAMNHGGVIVAARASDARTAGQVEELMLEHGATQCLHVAGTGTVAG